MKLSDADLDDIQGLVRFGYRGYPYAAYALIRFGADHAANRRWVRTLVASGPIDTAVKSRRPGMLHRITEYGESISHRPGQGRMPSSRACWTFALCSSRVSAKAWPPSSFART